MIDQDTILLTYNIILKSFFFDKKFDMCSSAVLDTF